ncbi:MAG: hypothetical protein JW747_07550, partial [Candidatus Aminicenantes bacterium]|nr:hypothetical protein [Candidatus Aminicenantes bacterium]
PAMLIIWSLGNLPPGAPFEKTAVGHIVQLMDPLGRPLGLTGEMLASLVFTLPAKEIVVASLAMTYGFQTTLADSETILSHLASTWSPLTAFSFITFYMLYLPCLVTVWAIWKETRRIRWLMTSLIVSLTMSVAVTFLVSKGGSLLGVP